jgi:hypothetical protein
MRVMPVSKAPDKMLQSLARNSSVRKEASHQRDHLTRFDLINVRIYKAGSTLTVRLTKPATRPTNVSPALTAATPSGVPV